MFVSGRNALTDVRVWSGCHAEYPEVIVRPSRMYGSGPEPLPDVREWSGCPAGCPEVVGRPSRVYGSGPAVAKRLALCFGSGWEVLLKVWE